MSKLTTAYCPKDGTKLHVVDQHKPRSCGLLTVFQSCPKCGHWLFYEDPDRGYLGAFTACYLLPDELPASKRKALVDAQYAHDQAASTSHLRIAA